MDDKNEYMSLKVVMLLIMLLIAFAGWGFAVNLHEELNIVEGRFRGGVKGAVFRRPSPSRSTRSRRFLSLRRSFRPLLKSGFGCRSAWSFSKSARCFSGLGRRGSKKKCTAIRKRGRDASNAAKAEFRPPDRPSRRRF